MDKPSTSSRFPGFDKVYSLGDPVADKPYRGEMKVRHPEQFSFTRCESRPKKAVTITHDRGEAVPRDAFWTSAVAPLIVSQRFVDVLMENQFTGWGTYPVKVHAKGGELVPGYHGLCIGGRCGPILWEKSEVIYKDYPGGRFPCYKGEYFDPDTWDGSDFFVETTDTAQIFVVEPVKKALEKAKIRNLLFERLDEIVLQVELNPNYKEAFPDLYRST